MPAFSILLPHKLNPGNNAALSMCVDCLTANTHHDFALSVSAAADQPLYATMNRLVEEAHTDICVFMHSDMFVAPSWDVGMLDVYRPDWFVTGLLVEPGAIGVYHGNVQRDFGRKPSTFQRGAFEAWATSPEAPHASGAGWVAPVMFSRERFLALGGFNIANPNGVVWTELDRDLFNLHLSQGGQVIQARAIVFHLQRYSEIEEQQHEKRNIQS